MATLTLSIDPKIRKFNANSAQFSAGNTAIVNNVPATLTGSVTFGFGIGNQNNLFFRNKVKFTIDSINLTNIATYEIWQNGTSIGTDAAPPASGTVINWGDIIYITCTRSTGGLNGDSASIELVSDDMNYSFTVTSKAYFYTRDLSFTEGVGSTATDYYINTDLGQRFGAFVANYTQNFIGNEQITNQDFEIILDPINGYDGNNAKSYRGLNDGTISNTIANRYPRQRYMLSVYQQNRYGVFEFGAAKYNPFDNDCGNWIFKIELIGGTAKYYSSKDNEATWILEYTSLDTYTKLTDIFNSDLVMLNAGYNIKRPDRVRLL